MTKHRRYPKKSSRKYKVQVLPTTETLIDLGDELLEHEAQFVNPPSKLEQKRNLKKNKPPPKDMVDEQPVTRRLRELDEYKAKIKNDQQTMRKKRRKAKNNLQEQAERLGYKQRPWEDAERLIHRISRDTNKAINDEMLKARFGKAGRDVKEIAKEYQVLDKKAEKKKQRRLPLAKEDKKS